jgi:hypothetical protein
VDRSSASGMWCLKLWTPQHPPTFARTARTVAASAALGLVGRGRCTARLSTSVAASRCAGTLSAKMTIPAKASTPIRLQCRSLQPTNREALPTLNVRVIAFLFSLWVLLIGQALTFYSSLC